MKAGIIDPVKVVRTALMDSASVASLLTTSEVIVVRRARQRQGRRRGRHGGHGRHGWHGRHVLSPAPAKRQRRRLSVCGRLASGYPFAAGERGPAVAARFEKVKREYFTAPMR